MTVTFTHIYSHTHTHTHTDGLPGGSAVKNLPANAGDVRDAGLIPESGRSSEGRNGNPLQYSCLENPMGRGAWGAIVHGVTESVTPKRLTQD